VLDIGCGSGYLCAAFYEMVKNKDQTARVVGIDRIKELTEFAVKNLSKNYMQ
jgi:protein-L-isoaspartate(D-aspartate) O-methyltransferase